MVWTSSLKLPFQNQPKVENLSLGTPQVYFLNIINRIVTPLCCRCGKCRRYMKLVSFNTSRLHCSICNDTHSVPQNGALRAYNDIRCPLDDFELIEWNGGAGAKSYIFCPYCINNPPFEYDFPPQILCRPWNIILK